MFKLTKSEEAFNINQWLPAALAMESKGSKGKVWENYIKYIRSLKIGEIFDYTSYAVKFNVDKARVTTCTSLLKRKGYLEKLGLQSDTRFKVIKHPPETERARL